MVTSFGSGSPASPRRLQPYAPPNLNSELELLKAGRVLTPNLSPTGPGGRGRGTQLNFRADVRNARALAKAQLDSPRSAPASPSTPGGETEGTGRVQWRPRALGNRLRARFPPPAAWPAAQRARENGSPCFPGGAARLGASGESPAGKGTHRARPRGGWSAGPGDLAGLKSGGRGGLARGSDLPLPSRGEGADLQVCSEGTVTQPTSSPTLPLALKLGAPGGRAPLVLPLRAGAESAGRGTERATAQRAAGTWRPDSRRHRSRPGSSGRSRSSSAQHALPQGPASRVPSSCFCSSS